jgi:predicted XRE-type DNA-binding protein
MKNAKPNSPGHVTTGDVFDDLGFSPAEAAEAKIKSDLLHELLQCIEARGYSQAQLAEVLGIYQPDVSNLLKGKISKFSITKLIHYAVILNLNVQLKLTGPKAKSALPGRTRDRVSA